MNIRLIIEKLCWNINIKEMSFDGAQSPKIYLAELQAGPDYCLGNNHGLNAYIFPEP